MARILLDFNAIEDKKFEPYPVGRYRLRVKEVRQKASNASGELVLNVTFEIVDGPNGSTEFAGKKAFGNYSLQQKAGFRVKRFLAAAGVAADQMNDFDDEELVGREIFANIKIEMYQGRQQNRIDNEDPIEGTADAAASPVVPGSFAPPPAGFGAPATGWGTATPAGAPPPPPAKVVSE